MGWVTARQVYQNPLFFEVNFYSYLIVNLNNSGSVRPVWTNLVSNACYSSNVDLWKVSDRYTDWWFRNLRLTEFRKSYILGAYFCLIFP